MSSTKHNKNSTRLRKYSDSTVYHRYDNTVDNFPKNKTDITNNTPVNKDRSRDLKRSQSSFPAFSLSFQKRITRVKSYLSPVRKSASLEDLDNQNNNNRTCIMKTKFQSSVTNDHWLDQDEEVTYNDKSTDSTIQKPFWTENIDQWLSDFNSELSVSKPNWKTEPNMENRTVEIEKAKLQSEQVSDTSNKNLQHTQPINIKDKRLENFRNKNPEFSGSFYDNLSPENNFETKKGFINLSSDEEKNINIKSYSNSDITKSIDKSNLFTNDNIPSDMNDIVSSVEARKNNSEVKIDYFVYFKEKFDYFVKDYIETHLSTQKFGDGLVAKNWCRELSNYVRENIRSFSKDDFKLIVTAHIGPSQTKDGAHIFLKAQTIEGQDKFMISVYETDYLFIWVYALVAST